jgi:two-component system NtrC family sensor kinase
MRLRVRIGIKIVIAVVALAVLVIGITSRFSFSFYREAILDQMLATGKQFSSTIKNSARYDMLANRYDNVKKIIAAVGRQEGVARVRLFAKTGDIFYSSVESEVGQRFNLKDYECGICHGHDKRMPAPMTLQTRIHKGPDGVSYLSILDPVQNEPSCWTAECHYHPKEMRILGVLDVAIPLTQMEQQIREGSLRTLLFALTAIIMVSVITLLIVRRLVLAPVAQLVDATTRVAQGEWTDPIPGGRQDEMGDLIRAFNRMQEKLQVSQRQLVMSGKLASVGKLAAGVAHEINNPLTAVLTFADDLLDDAAPDDPRREDYEIIKRETMRCRGIVRNLLDFARQDKPHVSAVDINEVLTRTLVLVERLAQFQNAVIRTDLQPSLPLVRGDAGQLQQVYLNLLVNAAEAMPQGGEIYIETSHGKGDPLITTIVRDTGAGMSDEQRSRIFEPFFSTKEGRTQGLGLSVTWGILEQHGGSIDVTSNPEEGTTFIVRLPVDVQRRSGSGRTS